MLATSQRRPLSNIALESATYISARFLFNNRHISVLLFEHHNGKRSYQSPVILCYSKMYRVQDNTQIKNPLNCAVFHFMSVVPNLDGEVIV
jgi:hypothetical protein